jgi:hypothetical protein
VGELARLHFPTGTLIALDPRDRHPAVLATTAALEAGAPILFEASFEADAAFASIDILERNGAAFTLIEVKATVTAKPPHLADLALQVHLARRAGLQVSRVEVMHLNRNHRHPDVEPLFVRTDVTADVEALVPEVIRELTAQRAMLDGACPEVAIGPHCDKPYPCPFRGRCWPERPKHDVSELCGSPRKAEQLRKRGYELIADLPETERLGPVAARQRHAVIRGEMIVEEGLGVALAALREPIAFLDFETLGLALPVWRGCAPYQAIPVQYSAHCLTSAGTVTHHELLADGDRDPREELARHLLDATRDAATVLAWNAGFERLRIRELANALPHLAADLLELERRVRDLLRIVRAHVYHPEFRGSFSLKSVGPALVPELTYSDLAVADGATASLQLERYLLRSAELSAGEREELRAALLDYCKRDTELLMRVFGVLRGLAR